MTEHGYRVLDLYASGNESALITPEIVRSALADLSYAEDQKRGAHKACTEATAQRDALLAALEGLLECEVAACNGCDEYGGFSDQIITPRFDAARAAIAAAKGEA